MQTKSYLIYKFRKNLILYSTLISDNCRLWQRSPHKMMGGSASRAEFGISSCPM